MPHKRKRKSLKTSLMDKIRVAKGIAVSLRREGKIQSAMRWESDVDRLVKKAELKGWADEALEAEFRGINSA